MRFMAGGLSIALGLLAYVPLTVGAQDRDIGKAIVAANIVEIVERGSTKPLRVDDGVRFATKLQTGRLSANVDLFDDGSQLTLGENAEVHVDRFVYNPATSSGEMAVNLVRGVLRFGSGRLPREGYTLRTDFAALGIRGTMFVLSHSLAAGTTVVVESGTVRFANLAGVAVEVPAGMASTISEPGGAPSSPAAASPGQMATVASLNTTVGTIAAPAQSLAAGLAGLGANAAAAASAAAAAPAMSPATVGGGDGGY